MINIGGIIVGGKHPARFVAEISNNHNGSLIRAKQLIVAAANAGANFVKFQCYTPAELVTLRGDGPAPEPWGSQGWTMRTLYEKAATPLAWFPDLFKAVRQCGMVPFSSAFGPESVAVLESVGCPAYKIARLDNTQMGLLQSVVATGKPVIVSVGPGETSGADLVLYCPPGYPQPAMSFTPALWDTYHGLSYHGTDPLTPMEAVATGAELIEVHLQLADEPSELEAHVSLNEHQFAQMVRGC